MMLDTSDMASLYARYHQSIRAFIGLRVHNDALADDLTQETFVGAWRTFATTQRLGTGADMLWLRRIALNRIYDANRFLRRQKREGGASSLDELGDLFELEIVDPFHGHDPAQVVCVAETLAAVRDAFHSLTAHDQTTLLLSVCGYSGEEIAVRLDISSADIARGAVYRARKAFRRAYQQTGDGEDVA